MKKIKRALISVSNKKGIVEFARELVEMGVTIISTGGTAEKITRAGLPVTPINEITGYPEMMKGRVKTLHPAVHAGLLASRENDKHLREIKEQGIDLIDLVVCNLYPFAETVAQDSVSLTEAIENIDIGGPTMIRAGAKNFQDVTVVVDPADYDSIVQVMADNGGEVPFAKRQYLAKKAFAHTANYDQRIEEYLTSLVEHDQEVVFPEKISLKYKKWGDLRYGENPHQRAAFYQENEINEPSLASAEKLHGKELSFNNINDTNGALELIKEFKNSPAAAVIKHANPCGTAVADTAHKAFERAYAGDPMSAFGSIVALNCRVSTEVAEKMIKGEKFIEVVIAPEYTKKALQLIKKRWENIRILRTGELFIDEDNPGFDMKKVTGGLLVQERDLDFVNRSEIEVVTKKSPSDEMIEDLLFSWKVVKHVKSNAIVMAKDRMLVGVGAGQMSRVDAMIIAGRKAEGRQEGGVVASDAFFPFPDAVEEAAKKGIKAIIQPGGSIRDDQVIARADELGLTMVFTGRRHFRH